MSSLDSTTEIGPLLERGLAAQDLGDLAEAERLYRAALTLDAGHPQALCLLGMLAGRTGRLPVAAAFFRRGLERAPDSVDLHHNLGETYRHLRDFEKAHDCFMRAIGLEPKHFAAYRSAADSAEEAARSLAPGQAPAAAGLRRLAAQCLGRLGEVLIQLARSEEAETALRQAVALDTRNPRLQALLGIALRLRGRLSESEKVLRHGIGLDPRMALAHAALGNTLYDLGRIPAAEQSYRKALALEPGLPMAEQGLLSLRLMTPLYDPAALPAQIFAQHRAWGEQVVGQSRALPQPHFAAAPDPDRRLRIGYVSPDFRRHSVAYFIEPLLAAHDPAVVESFCYAQVSVGGDDVTQRLKGLAQHWRPTVGLGDEELRRVVQQDGIDILIDLAGHSTGNRLTAFAVKPAPVTATWLGYPTTTGLPTIDWRITDALADPPGAEAFHTERLLRLDGGFLCYRPPEEAPEVAPLPAPTAGRVTFGSFNNLAKLTSPVVEAWAAILQAVPGSRLVCKAALLADPAIQRRTLALFAAQGIGPDRLDLRPWVTATGGHLAAYAGIDLALDPFPYNGTTTTCEALWMGVPVVTLAGERHAGRVGLSLLAAAGLGRLAAADRANYHRIATELAADLPALGRLRQELRARLRAAPLCDAEGFARRFEAGLRRMWRDWCAGLGREPAISRGSE